jgi:membrane-bound serine protease (ClpP class)
MTLRYASRLLLLLVIFFSVSGYSATPVWLIDIKGAIGPATADHIERGLDAAEQASAELLILRIDTPGGLDSATRQINKAILAANIPVVGFVAPSGARAASAGTYILYACHLAAMAPATNLGAATPVKIGPPSLPGTKPGAKPATNGDKESESPVPASTAMERKIINDAVAYIQGLAQLRGRNSEWAESAVREGLSIPSEQALELQVINLVASDTEDLLTKLNGQTITFNDQNLVIQISDPVVFNYLPDWRTKFLSVITDPNIAYILMLVGIYGLIFEAYNPGGGVPGVVGAVCLLMALYAFQVLPISYAGLALIILGIGLMVAEAFAPSFGVLGLGGIVAFVVGSIMLIDTEAPGFQIAWPIIGGVTLFSAGLLLFALGLVIKSRRQAVVTGLDHLVGAQASIEAVSGGHPLIRLEGELWQVTCEQPLQPGDTVQVIAAPGVMLTVSKTGESLS